ncbi:hypothetical protein LCGC14_1260310 [marine sediment metagenome]|uniref:Uncharacterized protein n=1 Tax=marine sediment metagenome TaxID=412755 RepID=A0A0F9L3F8_9ZZZZ
MVEDGDPVSLARVKDHNNDLFLIAAASAPGCRKHPEPLLNLSRNLLMPVGSRKCLRVKGNLLLGRCAPGFVPGFQDEEGKCISCAKRLCAQKIFEGRGHSLIRGAILPQPIVKNSSYHFRASWNIIFLSP